MDLTPLARRPPALPSEPAPKRKPPAVIEPEAQEVFGKRLREAREAAGMSQVELARLSGIPQTNLPGIEAGRIDVRLSTARRLARALNVSLHSLLPLY
jgi:ribosome-binding protein aMBF1 (putative translation factor)